MITLATLASTNRRAASPSIVVELANALEGSAPIRPQDPIQGWKAHPVVSLYLDKLIDRDIVTAIELHNGCNY